MSAALKFRGDQDLAARVAAISSVGLFDDLKTRAGALEALAGRMEHARFVKGQPILEEGKAGDDLFVLLSGHASVLKKTLEGDLYKVAHLSADQHVCFGEGGLLDGEARSATILAESDCECLVLSRARFHEFCQDNPQWALPVVFRVASKVMSRLRKSNADLMLLYAALVSGIRGH